MNLKEILIKNYDKNIIEVLKNQDSTVGNVYMVYTDKKKYVIKIYDDFYLASSMINIHINLLKNGLYVPSIIKSKNNNNFVKFEEKYIVMYSFLDGIQIGEEFKKIPSNIIKKIAVELRKMHDLKLKDEHLSLAPFHKNDDITRYSIVHFDLTKHNIFNNNGKIGFIDFDDAKYGPSFCDVAI